MPSFETHIPIPQLAPEDQIWAGMTFEVIDTSEMPVQYRAVGDEVHYHRGVWWKQLNSFFCTPCSIFEVVSPSESWPKLTHALAGYSHLCGSHGNSNSIYRAIVNDDVKNYSLMGLSGKRNMQEVRRALNKTQVRQVTTDELVRDGVEVYASWHQRVGWGRDRSRESAERWLRRACSRPKRMVLGAFVGDKLVAFMLPYATGSVVCPSFVASHTEYLKYRPNDALHHAVLCISRQTPGITMVDFGPLCNKPTLNEFKLRFGSLREFPAYTWVHPLIRIAAQGRFRARYPWLSLASANQNCLS